MGRFDAGIALNAYFLIIKFQLINIWAFLTGLPIWRARFVGVTHPDSRKIERPAIVGTVFAN
jgi:hypothetical protein